MPGLDPYPCRESPSKPFDMETASRRQPPTLVSQFPFPLHSRIGDSPGAVRVLAARSHPRVLRLHAPPSLDAQVKNPERPAFLAMHVATTIQQQLEEMLVKKYNSTMRVRAGIACGSVCAGVIDGRSFRMFGRCVHESLASS